MKIKKLNEMTVIIVSALIVLLDKGAMCDDFTWDPNTPALVEVNNKSISGTLTLPEIVAGKPLSSVQNMAFYGCDKIEEIIFPTRLEVFHICNRGYETKAGNAASSVFEGCWALTNAVFKGEPPWNLQSSGLLVYADCVYYPVACSNQWQKIMMNISYGGHWICYSGEWPDIVPILKNGKPVDYVDEPPVVTNYVYSTITNYVFSTVTNELHHYSEVTNELHHYTTDVVHHYSTVTNELHHYSEVTNELHHYTTDEVHHYSTVTNELHFYDTVTNVVQNYTTVTNELHHYSEITNALHHYSTVTNELHHYDTVTNVLHHYSEVTNELHHYETVTNEVQNYSIVTNVIYMTVTNVVRYVPEAGSSPEAGYEINAGTDGGGELVIAGAAGWDAFGVPNGMEWDKATGMLSGSAKVSGTYDILLVSGSGVDTRIMRTTITVIGASEEDQDNDTQFPQVNSMGGNLENGVMTFLVNMDYLPNFGKDLVVLQEALPTNVVLKVTGGKKLDAGKAATLKYQKISENGRARYVLVGLNDAGKPNLSGLKLSYTPKTGLIKGSFNVYASNAAGIAVGVKPKLMKYKVNVSAVIVNGVGIGQATIDKPISGKWAIEIR